MRYEGISEVSVKNHLLPQAVSKLADRHLPVIHGILAPKLPTRGKDLHLHLPTSMPLKGIMLSPIVAQKGNLLGGNFMQTNVLLGIQLDDTVEISITDFADEV